MAVAVENSTVPVRGLGPSSTGTGDDTSIHSNQGHSPVQNLSQMLKEASKSTNGLTFYAPGKEGVKSCYVSYADIQANATHKARLLRRIEGLTASSIVLLHFSSQYEVVQWLWATIIAGLLPSISTPLAHD